jgi:hypothetical protein
VWESNFDRRQIVDLRLNSPALDFERKKQK